jgi:hypothetical protein
MADFDLATVTSALAQNYRNVVQRTFNSTAMTLRVFRTEQGAGKNVAVDIEGTGAVAENFADGADVASYGIDTPAPMTLPWGLYRGNFKVTNLARSAARTSMTPEGLKPLGRQFVNTARKVASTLNAAAYAGAGTGTLIAGLDLALDDANTYGGINRTTNAAFRALKRDPGSLTDPTIAQIRKDLYDIRDACGEMPDIALCSSGTFLKIAALFDPLRRFEQSITIDTRGNGSVVLDASVGKVVFEGCVFIVDKDATANKIYYLNSQYVYWQYLPAEEDPELPSDMAMMQLEDSVSPLPLGMAVYPLARTGAARKVTCEVQAQLVVQHPLACGVRLNVNN